MALKDTYLKIIHQKTVRSFEDFIQNHKDAVKSLCEIIKYKKIFERDNFYLWREYKELYYEYTIDYAIRDNRFSFEQMKAVVEKRDTILELYKVYKTNKDLYDDLEMQKKTYPNALRYVCLKETGIAEIKDCHDLNLQQVRKILIRKNDFPAIERDIKNTINKYHEIEKNYPVGLKSFLEIQPRASYKTIVESESQIAQYEIYEKRAKDDSIWEKEQEAFAHKCYDLHCELLKNWGCFDYDIDFSKIDKFGKEIEGDYYIWQMFCSYYCSAQNLDYTNFPVQKKNYELLPLLKTHESYFTNDKYETIAKYINALALETKALVYFNDHIVGWWNNQLLAHYNQLLPYLNKDVLIYNLASDQENGIEGTKDEWITMLNRHIIIVDIVTENDYLKELCKKIITKAKDKRPLITYISMMKCLSEEEMQEYIDLKNAIIEKKRQKEIEEKFEKEVLGNDERNSCYLDFCKAKNIKEQDQKAFVLQNLQELDNYIPIAKRNEAQRLIQLTSNAGWESRFNGAIRTFSLYNYYPTTCDWEVDEDDWEVRNLIWNFKNSQEKAESWRPSRNMFDNPHIKYIGAINTIIPLIKKVLVKTFGDDLSMLTLACIPASTRINTSRRYARFSDQLCERTNMINGYDYIKILQEGQAKHLGGNTSNMVECDKDFFKGKFVILFDDVITKGNSMMRFKRELENCGAYIIGGMSVGRTKHEKVDTQPIDELERASSINTSILPF